MRLRSCLTSTSTATAAAAAAAWLESVSAVVFSFTIRNGHLQFGARALPTRWTCALLTSKTGLKYEEFTTRQ
ncbi:hypothetical protein E2C01_026605 [Portunus trituberculatus]|uniref:Secreted protein n=1 Tax=Portunus trituberculatus TaxID=210409 RepID=A0A5B7EG02_PORTR|nr:hypothetical protein [Portunus trituberculatus]